MNSPYRESAEKPPETVQVKSDNCTAKFSYLMPDGEIRYTSLSWKGVITAQAERSSSGKTHTYSKSGVEMFDSFMESGLKLGYYQIGKVLVPPHRLLLVEIEAIIETTLTSEILKH